MKLLYLFLFVFFFFVVDEVSSQKTDGSVSQEDKFIKQIKKANEHIFMNFEPQWENYLQLCILSSGFAKFYVNEKNKIHDLNFTNNFPEPLKKDLQKAIYSSEGKWPLPKKAGKKYRSLLYLLPISFDYWTGCEPHINPDQSRKDNPSKDKMIFEVNSMLYYQNCIILRGFSIQSPNFRDGFQELRIEKKNDN